MNVLNKGSNVEQTRCASTHGVVTSVLTRRVRTATREGSTQGKISNKIRNVMNQPWILQILNVLFLLCHSTCYRPCASRRDCGIGGSFPLLQYKLLTLPLGIPTQHSVARLSAFSESGVLQDNTSFTILEQTGDSGASFGIKDEAGRGIIFTLKPLHRPGLVRLRVQATTMSDQGHVTYQSIFIIYISISKYPFWAYMTAKMLTAEQRWICVALLNGPLKRKINKWTCALLSWVIKNTHQTFRIYVLQKCTLWDVRIMQSCHCYFFNELTKMHRTF